MQKKGKLSTSKPATQNDTATGLVAKTPTFDQETRILCADLLDRIGHFLGHTLSQSQVPGSSVGLAYLGVSLATSALRSDAPLLDESVQSCIATISQNTNGTL